MALNLNTDLAFINTNSNSGTITLPASATSQGRVITFKDIQGTFNTNTLTLQCAGSDTFEDGGTVKVLRESYGSIQIVASGTKWYILNGTQVNTLQVSSLNVLAISSLNISTINATISTLKFIDNRLSTNQLNVSSAFLSTQNVSTNLLYYNNYVIAGTRVGYSNVLNRYTSNFINPTILSGLVLWLDGADGDTLFTDNGITKATVGQSIFRWSDKSASRNNAIQSGAVGTRPVLSTDAVTGKTVLSFSSASLQKMLLTPTLLPIGTSDGTYFIVLKPSSAVACNVFSYGTAGEIGTGVTGRYRVFIFTNSASSYMACVYAARTFAGLTVGQTALFTGIIGSYIQSFSLNGGSFATANLFPSGIFNTGSGFASIGGNEVGGGGTGPLQGDVLEIIVYNYALGLKDQQLIQGYLAWKWGSQANLPVNHPYRNAPP